MASIAWGVIGVAYLVGAVADLVAWLAGPEGIGRAGD